MAGAPADGEKPSTIKEAGVLGIEDVASYSDFFPPEESVQLTLCPRSGDHGMSSLIRIKESATA
jgi:hypothetical protein